MMRLMVRAAISMCVGLILLMVASSGWLAYDGTIIRVVLFGAIITNALAALYFMRYLLAIVRAYLAGR
jgi:hypothetical protein